MGLLLVVGVYAAFLDLRGDEPLGSDFAGFHHSVGSALEGGDPYAPLRPPDGSPVDFSRGGLRGTFPNLNPPVFALFLLPLGLLPLGTAFALWTAAGLLCGAGSVLRVTRGEPGPVRVRHALLLFAWYPVVLAVTVGQPTLFLVLGLALAGSWWERGRTRGAAVVLGLLASLKLFFGLFGVLLLFARRYRALGWMVMAFVASWTVGLLVFGADAYVRYAETLGSVDWHGVGGNVSLAGTAERLFDGPAASGVFLLGGIGVLLVGLARVARSWRGSELPAGVAFAYVAASMLLLSPLGWSYYLPLLYPGFVHLWRASDRVGRGLLTAAALVTAVPPVYLIPSSLEGAAVVRGVVGTAALATAAAVAWWTTTHDARAAGR